MRQGVIYALPIILALLVTEGVTAGEDGTEKGASPLLFMALVENQFYQADTKNASELAHQHTGYFGTSLKPFPYGWFHLGLKSRMSRSAELQSIYLEPAGLHLAAGLTVLKDLLYGVAGLQLPLAPQQVSRSEEDGFSSLLNDFSYFTEPNVLPLNSVMLGGFMKRRWGRTTMMTGISYVKPASYELYSGFKEFPAAFLDYRVRGDYKSGEWICQLDGKITDYGWEKDRQRKDAPVHQEGTLFQARVCLKKNRRTGGVGAAAGTAVKSADESRLNLAGTLDSYNRNYQRFYLEFLWTDHVGGNMLMQASLTPQLLKESSAADIGYMLEPQCSLKFRAFSGKVFKVAGSFITGSIGDVSLMGGSIKIMVSFGRTGVNIPLYPPRNEE